MLRLWYLSHSGFAVETDRHLLVFDYWKGGLSGGSFGPRELAEPGKQVVVFSSHRHGDHFNRVILDWKRELPALWLVLSDDIPAPPGEGILLLGPGQERVVGELSVRALASTDEGVAFLVEVDGLRLYHAGDLNWWHWEGEPDAFNEAMGLRYRREIAGLDLPIDLAFVPVDPRLGEQAVWGLDYLMRHVDVKTAIPMHFWGNPQTLKSILADPVTEPYRGRILTLTEQGGPVSLA